MHWTYNGENIGAALPAAIRDGDYNRPRTCYAAGDGWDYVALAALGYAWEDDPVAEPTAEELAAAVRAERDAKIYAVAWRVERYHRQVRLGLTTTDDIAVLDAYIQALCDVPEQEGFPGSVTWPTEPAG